MGRRKQSRPNRSCGKFVSDHSTDQFKTELERPFALDSEESETDRPYFVEVHGSSLGSDSDESKHLDISEIVLLDLNFGERFSQEFFAAGKYGLRLRLENNQMGRADRLRWHRHWPILPSSNVFLEFFEKDTLEDGLETCSSAVLSGRFDGPDEGVSGLAHLVSLKFVALRPVVEEDEAQSVRLRVEILGNAFEACESLLENTCKVWRKSMKNVMAWLRPEVVTSEARYGVSAETDRDSNSELDCRRSFDVAGFYEAIKPSKADAMLEDDLPELLPELRPYQRRAAHWMVQREKGCAISKPGYEEDQLVSPWCLPVEFLSGDSKMFYNPFSGNVSLKSDRSSERVPGGILADEMGLGKTVELLACILTHPKKAYDDSPSSKESEDTRVLRRLKKERVECVCGAVSENHRYKGMWVQCDVCSAWQHADCVGYSVKGKTIKSEERKGQNGKKNTTVVAERDGEYICQRCSELKQAVESPVPSGATLIVCPAPILPQWSAEITRHTRPGALKTHIYDGVREASLTNSAGLDIEELVNADIVLTTYDVLREDLSHDSDRHEGDRRFLRFQKRYPVIPTHLTRISWWRVCLDEAQMVENSATAATEMAQRLHAKYRWCITGTPIQRKLDDLFGLLRFLKASPFDVSRWWVEVMRDPYEKKDIGAMEFTRKFFKRIMWRSSKVHVTDELLLPPQEDCTSWLSFSPVEEHFYLRQHESCASFACVIIESLRNDLRKREATGGVVSNASSDHLITHADAGKLLNTLLKLRQACCHPQVGSSGLRSLQQSPMTMEEILMVLISKTKTEGEESLRRLVLALNGLAGISMIEGNANEAASLYKEGLAVAEEHSDDFRLDPLMNIHIFHNLSEILPQGDDCTLSEKASSQIAGNGVLKRHGSGKFKNVFKRRKLSTVGDDSPENNSTNIKENGSSVNLKCDDAPETSSRAIGGESLRVACDSLKQKFLTVFNSRLYTAQEDFQKSYVQVCSAIDERQNLDMSWWMDALIHAEQDNDFSTELNRKIEEAISGSLNNSRSPRIPTGFRSISGMKYYIQSGLDQMEECRKVLLDQLIAIDKTMDKPKEEDILRVRFCNKCQVDGDGPLCVMCELDDLFQNYEARLFRLNKAQGGTITSAEEAVDLQKKNSALNRYYWNLAQPNKTSNLSGDGHEESRKRDVREKIVVSKSPSELEVVLGVIKSHCKAYLGNDVFSAATKHLHMLEGMRKEYAHARALAVAHAQVLQAHDEIKMATTRLELRVQDDNESLNALSEYELASASVQCTNDKFVAVNMLSSIKGKLRYLQGLVQAKKNLPSQNSDKLSSAEEASSATASVCSGLKNQCLPKADDESCPVCQELLSARKMVFQCGHVTCYKCLIAMTERRVLQDNEAQNKWIKCPTCRQRTDCGNIAYVDDRQNEPCTSLPTSVDGPESWGSSIVVQGSYGTKIEAVTRRVLWIKSKDPEEKVLVFSSWNDVLNVLEHAFAANNISFIRMKGGRKSHVAIREFTKEGNHGKNGEKKSSVQVLLLLIQHGANGLNLLEAQNVVLVEPLLNPAAEAQAISRVHRIGQQNKTLVHRFIVKNTVEESIYKLNRSKSTTVLISGNTKNQDQPFLTLKDMESLFTTSLSNIPDSAPDDKLEESLRHLPPSVAAAIAAEKRLAHKPSSSGEATL